jgi:phage shock protein PspC (stress-responsive transcriptional regulator)
MNETKPSDSSPPDHPGPRRLLRSREDRVFGGVAGGLARHFDIDPIIFRVGFVASVFLGGLGVFVYLALLIFVPEDDGTGRPAPQEERSRAALIAVAVVLGIAALAIFDGGWGWGWWWGPGLLFWVAVAIGAGFLARRFLRRRGGGETRAEAQPTGEETLPSGETAPAPPGRYSAGRVLGAVALALAALTAAAAFGVGSAWATAEGYGEAVAALVILIGLGLIAASFLKVRAATWLIAAALVLAVPLGAVAAADIHFEGGYGERDHRPTSIAAIPADGYELAVGDMTVDLRALDWARGEAVDMPLRLGLGESHVIVPDEVCVEAHGDGTAGLIDVRGSESWGADFDHEDLPPPGRAPRLRLDLELEIGHVEVIDETEYFERGGDVYDDRDGPRFHDDEDDDDDAEEARAQRACEASSDRRSR